MTQIYQRRSDSKPEWEDILTIPSWVKTALHDIQKGGSITRNYPYPGEWAEYREKPIPKPVPKKYKTVWEFKSPISDWREIEFGYMSESIKKVIDDLGSAADNITLQGANGDIRQWHKVQKEIEEN